MKVKNRQMLVIQKAQELKKKFPKWPWTQCVSRAANIIEAEYPKEKKQHVTFRGTTTIKNSRYDEAEEMKKSRNEYMERLREEVKSWSREEEPNDPQEWLEWVNKEKTL